MKLMDQVKELIDKKNAEMLELFSDIDRIQFDPDMVKQLWQTIPLIEDIKTEVSDVARQVHDIKDKQEKEEKDRDKSLDVDDNNNEPVNPPDPETQRMLDDMDKMLKDWKRMQKQFRRYKLPDSKPDLDFGEWLRNFASAWYLWKNLIEKKLMEIMKLDDTSLINQNIVRESNSILRRLETLDGFLSSSLVDIKDVVDTILDKLTRCCHEMMEYLSDINHTTSVIEHKIDILNPEGQVNQDLASEARLRGIQGDISAIRGLLRQPVFITVWHPDGEKYKPVAKRRFSPKLRVDPNTGTVMGMAEVLTDPSELCTIYKYKQTTYEWRFVRSSPYRVTIGGIVVNGVSYHFDLYEILTTWTENSCEPDEKKNIVTTEAVIDSMYHLEASDVQAPSVKVLNGAGVPEPIPEHIAAWLGASPGAALSVPTLQGWNTHGALGMEGWTPPSVRETHTDYQEFAPDSHTDDVEVRVYGYDRSDDDKSYVTAGVGFQKRDEVLLEGSVGQTVTREELSKASKVNGYIPGDWESGTIISASFTPVTTSPKDCGTYQVTYGYWIFHIRRPY